MHVDRLLDPCRCLVRRLDLHVHRRFLFLVLLVFDWLARLANHRRLLVVRFLDNDRFLKRRGSALFVFLVYTETGSAARPRILQRHILCKSTRYARGPGFLKLSRSVPTLFSSFRWNYASIVIIIEECARLSKLLLHTYRVNINFDDDANFFVYSVFLGILCFDLD